MMSDAFAKRHIGPREQEIPEMLSTVGVSSIEELINQTIPSAIRLKKDLDLPDPMSEQEFMQHIHSLAKKNKSYRSFIGLGYYPTASPSVIIRNIFENPGWYTSYTPYQAEISQGRLEALLNFQSMVTE
ncbi:MAG: glycine dehydrogenase (aminomethyl-transferring), partial [Bacteroidales bacterium]|nr:glycine dehydrogenase (aminomethyl-transferring) [Bacteroidales bacterium]